MAVVITPDEIDFAKYERETDLKQHLRPASFYIQQLIDEIDSEVIETHPMMPWPKMRERVDFREGLVTLWGGANGQGKSELTGQVALSLCAQAQRVAVASFEMPPAITMRRMGHQWAGEDISPKALRGSSRRAQVREAQEEFREWTNGRLWLYDQQGTVTPEHAVAMARYCAKERGITQLFIDSLMKCVAAEDDYNGQKYLVNELCAIARNYGIHIHLVHHIRKPPSEEHKPGKYDYKGSGSITDQVDTVLTLWRNKAKEKLRDEGRAFNPLDPDALLICDKNRYLGWEGSVGLWFHHASHQYLGSHGEAPMALYHHPEDP